MKGQKQAVVQMVQTMLPNFSLYKDIALVMLTKDQLNNLKYEVAKAIIRGDVEYSKDMSRHDEIFAYSRSMVMNHLKKAKELNGNQVYGVGTVVIQSKQSKALANINMDILTEDLKAFVNDIV